MREHQKLTDDEARDLRLSYYRLRNGLEYRLLLALLHTPRGLEWARLQLHSHDFRSAPYAALAGVLLSEDMPPRALELARDAVASHPYLPDPNAHDWDGEALALIHEMVERRKRWRQREAACAQAMQSFRETMGRRP